MAVAPAAATPFLILNTPGGGGRRRKHAMHTITSLEQVATLPQLRAWRTARSPEGEAYREFDPATARWVAISWAAFSERVAQWQAALAAQGLAPGARVAILLPNGVDAVCMGSALALARWVVCPCLCA